MAEELERFSSHWSLTTRLRADASVTCPPAHLPPLPHYSRQNRFKSLLAHMAFPWVLLKFPVGRGLIYHAGGALCFPVAAGPAHQGWISLSSPDSLHSFHRAVISSHVALRLPAHEKCLLKTARQSPALLAPRRSHFTSLGLGIFSPSTVCLDFSLVHFINTELNTCYMLNIPAERGAGGTGDVADLRSNQIRSLGAAGQGCGAYWETSSPEPSPKAPWTW